MHTGNETAHKTLVVTTFNHSLYSEYAHRFVATFPKHYLDLKIYSEDTGFEFKTTFLHMHRDFQTRNEHRQVRSYKNDGVRFCFKVYAISQALEDYAYDNYTRLLWVDGDTVFLKEISEEWITENLWNSQAIMGYAGRPNYYSEMGLFLLNLQHPHTRSFWHTVRNYYDTDSIYLLPEQHDSFVIDEVRKHYEQEGHRFNNWAQHITHKVQGGHILVHLYGDVMDHLKGKRKGLGKSPERKH
jgi:hypothetical protein